MLVWANVSNMMPLTPSLEKEKKSFIDYAGPANVSNMMPLTPFLEIEKKGLIDYESIYKAFLFFF
jgi:hypothetical protein